VLLQREGDRIYFADTTEQAIALLAATIGLSDQAREVRYLKRRAEAGPVDDLRWRGQAVCSLVGQLAYVGTDKQHPQPKLLVGHQVRFYSGHTTNAISGLALYKDRLNYGKTQWHYFYEGAEGSYHPMSEAHTQPAVPVALAA
jgi:hypothetical protein